MSGRTMVTEPWDLAVADDSKAHGASAAASAAALAAGPDPNAVATCALRGDDDATVVVVRTSPENGAR
jgi:hypothetical protein